MKLTLIVVVLVVLTLCQEGESKCFAQVCYGNRNNQIRGCDVHGCGHYGAPRPGYGHRGIDIICTAGSWVYAPFLAEVVGMSKPYRYGHEHYNQPFNTGYHLEGIGQWDGHDVYMWYVSKELDDGEDVDKGEFIGYSKDRTITAPGMTNHVHLELYKNDRLVNPTTYVC